MRGKRSKQYRKLMEQYSMSFGFREPYQVLLDAEMVRDSCRFKMDLAAGLARTVHGTVKPMITQCEIRKLYAVKDEPHVSEAIELAKSFERRRCGHHPDEHPQPLSTMECLRSVVDPKDTGQNKHRYVVACQDQDVRRMLRGVRGVPQVYIKRSVMILEPMADDSAQARAREERGKFRAGIKDKLGKRKRDAEDSMSIPDEDDDDNGHDVQGTNPQQPKSKKQRGPKGPNPLAVMKAKKKSDSTPSAFNVKQHGPLPGVEEAAGEKTGKRRRRRKKSTTKREGLDGEDNGAVSNWAEGTVGETD